MGGKPQILINLCHPEQPSALREGVEGPTVASRFPCPIHSTLFVEWVGNRKSSSTSVILSSKPAIKKPKIFLTGFPH
jgi:hypothetical protein